MGGHSGVVRPALHNVQFQIGSIVFAPGAAPGTEFSTLGDDYGPVSCCLWEYTPNPDEKQGLSYKTTHGQLQTTRGPKELTMEGFKLGNWSSLQVSLSGLGDTKSVRASGRSMSYRDPCPT